MVFLDLGKAYDALDRSRCLEILEGYGVVPKARRLLTSYWLRLTMVVRAGGYYGTAFGGERGVTQGDLLSPTIFNVVVNAVVRHWVHGVIEEAEARGGNRTGGPASGRTILRRRQHSPLVAPRLDTGRIYRPGRPLLQGGHADKFWEDCQHGLPPLPGYGRKQNTGGIREETRGIGEVLHGAAAQRGGMCGVWRTTGGRVNIESSDDSTWESGGVKTPMDTTERDRGPDIQDVLPD